MPYDLATLYDDVAQLQHRKLDLFGSGRLIGKNLVLTARHVVTAEGTDEPVKLEWDVRMMSGRPVVPEAQKWEWIEAAVVWTGAGSLDLALLKLSPQKEASDWHPRLKLRIAKIDQVRQHRVRGLGFPRGAKINDKRTLFSAPGSLQDVTGATLTFDINSAFVPRSPDEDWRGLSGGSVLAEDSPDADAVWIFGVAQQVPGNFPSLLSVVRLAEAWEDVRFRGTIADAGVSLDPPADPTSIQSQKIAPDLRSILSAHCENYRSTYSHVAVLGDHPADVLDTSLQVPYIRRRFDVKAPAQIEGTSQTTGRVEPWESDAKKDQPSQQDESFLLERLRAGGSWILVEGDGGSGKTEFARHAAAHFIEQLPAELERADRIPVFIELRALRGQTQIHSAETLMASMAEHAGKLAEVSGSATCFEQLASAGRLVLMLDGLDEFPDPEHFYEFDLALEEARQQFGLDRCSVLVTGRPSAFALTPRLRTRSQRLRVQPQPLTLLEVEAGIVEFFGADRAAATAMIRAVQVSRDSVQRLLGIPLFLTLACALWGRGDATHILSDAAAVMSNGLEHLLARRLEGPVNQALDDLACLAASACPTFDNIPHVVASRLVDETALKRYSRESGILRGGVGTGYRFGIRPLAEYLAARHFSRTTDKELVATFEQRVWSNRWREPLFWMAGELWKNSRESIALVLLNRLLDEIGKRGDDISETLFQRACEIVSASGEEERIPNTVVERLSGFLVPNKKNPNAVERLVRFEAEIGAWPEYVRDQLTRSALASARKTYSHLVVQALGALRCKRAIDPLAKFLKASGKDDLSHYVIRALGRVGNEAAVEILTRLLGAPESVDTQRQFVARELGNVGLLSAVPALVRCLENEPSEWVRGVVYLALADLGWPETVPRILQEIQRERNDRKPTHYTGYFSNLLTLASRSRDARREIGNFASKDPDPFLRYAAAVAIGLTRNSTFLIPDDIEDAEMDDFSCTPFTERSNRAGEILFLPSKTDDGAIPRRKIGTVLATVLRVSNKTASSGKRTVNRYHLVRLDDDDPEVTLDTLVSVKDVIDDPAALSSVATAIGNCGSTRSSNVLVQILRSSTNRDVLYEVVDALGDPSNRDAIQDLRKLMAEEDASDDLGDHAAEALLKIDATDPVIVAACIDAESADAVAETLRHHDHAVFCLPTSLIGRRFRDLPLRQQALKSVRGSSCVIVPRDALRLNTPRATGDRSLKGRVRRGRGKEA
jgi:HEAT repeat protein